MSRNPSGPVRRAQVIAPFGVGSMLMVPGGTSLIIAGLDYWYQPTSVSTGEVDVSEFVFQEWRLQELLQVDHFRLPPDYRETWRAGEAVPNAYMTIPALRFPAWHFCPDCHLLQERSPYERGVRGSIKCPECERRKKSRYMFQVPFVAMCEQGHLQDFPWREWVHRTANPTCKESLRLVSTGGATLASQFVRCDCGVSPRSLGGITNADNDGTFLTRNLDEDGTEYLCRGKKPWLGPAASDTCIAHLRGSLRNAMNVYFSQIRSAIYLPPVEDPVLQELIDLFERPPLSILLDFMHSLGTNNSSQIAELAQSQQSTLLRGYTTSQVAAAITAIIDAKRDGAGENETSDEDSRLSFRHDEYRALRVPRDEKYLKIRETPRIEYGTEVTGFFERIMLVDKLKETRAMAGFSRLFPGTNRSVHELKNMLFCTPPEKPWLPAYIVYGEGIFFEFSGQQLHSWEQRRNVKERVMPLAHRFASLQEERRLDEREITPRFVLLHTFAHLLINQLTFDCGYSSASLRERLYVSNEPGAEMAGVLIYTANGDSEGTMGGLVRMGKPGNIEPVIHKALLNARWCSADPVCMEMGRNGQGPDSCNLAACHNCALVPETACEEFNRFLDRALVVGSHDDPLLGFFQLE